LLTVCQLSDANTCAVQAIVVLLVVVVGMTDDGAYAVTVLIDLMIVVLPATNQFLMLAI